MTREEAINEIKSWDFLKGKEIEAIHTLIPELADSEDERIRKELVSYLTDIVDNINSEEDIPHDAKILGSKIRHWIAYLEKQKINTEGDFGRGYNCGYEACLNSHGAEWFEKQKEPNYTKKNALFDKCVENCNPEVMKRVSDEIDAELQKEQKPAEMDNKEIELSDFESELFSAFSNGWQQYLRGEEVDVAQWAKEHSAQLLDAAKQELKPAEWSEEDDVMLDKVCCLINPGTKLTDDNVDYCVELKLWIISLQERILKSLRPQSHWKPSDEQMEMLRYAYAEWNCGKIFKGRLFHLLNELEKL